ncbi:hypothetical protein PMZ80_002474 [Knufia obscura]|uniref:Heterokaryon incompatibility domain-containing protein n=2 Tax=Knufia TaxID=430999 RepID=A0AAN8ERR0_9EURO|nr:hypothetical protein PMZ80_002474 [Knufia obscura]KAK5950818.1 hypothetical protein OHC33_008201 [Knufia fluminis]
MPHGLTGSSEAKATSSVPAPGQPSFYTALDDAQCFRLLKFDRASFNGRTPTSIAFALEQYSLSEAPSYVAVSYTWSRPYRQLDSYEETDDPPKFDHEITINGASLAITENMWDAVVYTLAHTGSKHIWLDGCCINQSDLPERAAQVLLMGSIFAEASEVIGFLGPLHRDLDSFYWLLTELMPQFSKLVLEGQRTICDESLWNLRDKVTTDKQHFEASLVGAHRFYYSCNWFRRAWVKQEVVLARKLRLICGRSRLPWEGIGLTGVLFARSNWTTELFLYKHKDLYPFAENTILCTAFHEWRGFIEYRQDPTKALSFEDEVLLPTWKADSREKLDYAWLLEYVLSMRTAKCSDARDKVFSVLGLAAKHFAGTVMDVRPDYQSCAATVYISFFTSIVNHLGTLNFLAFIEPAADRSTANLPSWVPDLAFEHYYNGRHDIALGSTLFAGVEPQLLPFQTISCIAEELHFHGIHIDTIEAIQFEAKLGRYPTIANLLSLLNLSVPTVLQIHSLLLHTFAAEVTNHELPSFEMILQGANWFQQAGEHLVYEVRDPLEKTGDECHDWILWIKKAVASWEGAIKTAQTSRSRCFRTRRCRLGSANADVQVGDEVWFAPASSLPLVLRPVVSSGKRTYRFISVAYLHGAMDEELFYDDLRLLGQMEKIVLR